MKRRAPESGHDDKDLGYRIQRANAIKKVQAKVGLRKAEGLSSTAKSKPVSKRKTFFDFIHAQDKKNIPDDDSKENRDSSNKRESQYLSKKLEGIKVSQRKKTQKGEIEKTPKNDNHVSSNSLFPANISDADSDLIEDYSIKTTMRIFSTQNMDWVNSVAYNPEDIELKDELEKVLSYYVYPAQLLKSSKTAFRQSQLSQPLEKVSETEKIDKEWFLAFRDCYIKWLYFSDKEGALREFLLITNTYKVKFISKATMVNGELQREKFAVVTNPSEPLMKKLEDQKVPLEIFKSPDSDSTEDEEFRDSTIFSFKNGEIKKDELNLFDINLVDDVERKTVLIKQQDGVHALMNALLNLCPPYLKEVKLVASYSFTNSVHRNADIEYNGKMLMKKSLNTFGVETTKQPDWYSVELRGIFSFMTLKNLVQLLETRVRQKIIQGNETEVVRVSCATGKTSEGVNWIDPNIKSVMHIMSETKLEEEVPKTNYSVKFLA
ncbi:unnamed protein product [Moneuplotes crassus]|uniref:Uncharacterized protein n=1 Tax=Euplotes crassus TaxID=5936 RepID=A0AAD1XDG2_EUPCR|nr:unnamed protein product [Moneuplotes crassus]